MTRLLVGDELRGPHLVLSDARHVDRLRADDLREFLQNLLRGHHPVLRGAPSERVFLFQALKVGPPLRNVRRFAFLLQGGDLSDEGGDRFSEITDDRHIGVAVLRDFSGVNVDVYDLRSCGEGVESTGDAVIETRPEGDDEVGPLQGAHCGDGAVHSGHAEVAPIRVGESAPGGQGRDDWCVRRIDEACEILRSIRADHSTADVEHGGFR